MGVVKALVAQTDTGQNKFPKCGQERKRNRHKNKSTLTKEHVGSTERRHRDVMHTWGILWCCRRSPIQKLIVGWSQSLCCMTGGWGSAQSDQEGSPWPVSASDCLWMKGSTRYLHIYTPGSISTADICRILFSPDTSHPISKQAHFKEIVHHNGK